MAVNGIDPRYLSMYGTSTTGTVNPAVSTQRRVSGGTESATFNPAAFKGVVEQAVSRGASYPQATISIAPTAEKPVFAVSASELARVDSSKAIAFGSRQTINPFAQEYNNRYAAAGYSTAKHIEKAPQEAEAQKTDEMYANFDWAKTSGLVNYIDPNKKTFIA